MAVVDLTPQLAITDEDAVARTLRVLRVACKLKDHDFWTGTREKEQMAVLVIIVSASVLSC